jgi:ketosteroid isomerase-like protein
MSNVRTIQEIYAAFGRGDIPAILSRLSESVEWEYGPTSTDVPWLQRRRGRDGAAAFFASLAHFDMHAFRPKEFLEGDGVVVVLLDVDFTVRATGRRIVEEDEIHVWRFDAEGRVVRHRHGVDTHLHQLAWDAPSGG